MDCQGSGWVAMENVKDTTLTAITLGSKYVSHVRSPAPFHTQTLSNPFRNFTNKLRGKITYKEVFLRLSACVVYSCVFIIVRLSLLLCRCDAVDDYITLCSIYLYILWTFYLRFLYPYIAMVHKKQKYT